MEFHSGLNLLLEALTYLGRRAGGFDTNWMFGRLEQRGVEDIGLLQTLAQPIARLIAILDEALPLEEAELKRLFGNLPGLPYNTIGSGSRAFLLWYPMVARFRGSFSEILELARSRREETVAGDLADLLDLGDEPELSCRELTDRVLATNLPPETKVAALELFHQHVTLLEETAPLLERVMGLLERERPLLERCCADFVEQLRTQGPEGLLAQTSSLNTDHSRSDVVRPFLFGVDTLLAATPDEPGPVQVYCGILRQHLQTALASAKGAQVEVCEAIRLLADQTRFDIVCYLRNHDAYGQELAAKFGLSRNTIHHHMTKLLAAHLVKCTVDGNRVYYRSDEKSIRRLMDRLSQLLLPDA